MHARFEFSTIVAVLALLACAPSLLRPCVQNQSGRAPTLALVLFADAVNLTPLSTNGELNYPRQMSLNAFTMKLTVSDDYNYRVAQFDLNAPFPQSPINIAGQKGTAGYADGDGVPGTMRAFSAPGDYIKFHDKDSATHMAVCKPTLMEPTRSLVDASGAVIWRSKAAAAFVQAPVRITLIRATGFDGRASSRGPLRRA